MKATKDLIKKISIILILVIITSILSTNMYSIAAPTTYTQNIKSGIENFPAEYQESLNALKKLHPNWKFDAYYTGIPWNTLVDNETVHKRNRIIKSAESSWKCSCGNVASGYACASETIIKYYLDPRNFLNEVNIFQFLEISYNSKVHNLDGIKSIVKGTFLDKTIKVKKNDKEEDMSYSQIILEAAEKTKMSPYSIAIKIIQEVGSKGSDSVSGNYTGYKGYYNFFNLGAYDTGNAIVNALLYAKDKGWDNQYDAIIEGTQEIANSYTNAGQNTAYFYKWDVVGTSILQSGKSQSVSSSDMFWHQYMTNIQDPTSQSISLYNTYAENNILDKELNFIIPIYNNMPASNKLPTNLTSNDGDLYYVNCTDGLRVRQSPSTSAKILDTLGKDVTVIMLERKTKQADGIYWDKIKLSNGVVGYTATEFLTQVNSAKTKIDGTTLKAVPGATIKDISGATLVGDKFATGAKVKVDGKEYTLVVMGDTNGDGEVNSGDLLVVVKHLKGVTKLTKNEFIKASDINNDAEINSGDLLGIVKYLKGTNITL